MVFYKNELPKGNFFSIVTNHTVHLRVPLSCSILYVISWWWIRVSFHSVLNIRHKGLMTQNIDPVNKSKKITPQKWNLGSAYCSLVLKSLRGYCRGRGTIYLPNCRKFWVEKICIWMNTAGEPDLTQASSNGEYNWNLQVRVSKILSCWFLKYF